MRGLLCVHYEYYTPPPPPTHTHSLSLSLSLSLLKPFVRMPQIADKASLLHTNLYQPINLPIFAYAMCLYLPISGRG